jgi:hypothetical protein
MNIKLAALACAIAGAVVPVALHAQNPPPTVSLSLDGSAPCDKTPLLTARISGPAGASGTVAVVALGGSERREMTAAFELDESGTADVSLKDILGDECDGGYMLEGALHDVRNAPLGKSEPILPVDLDRARRWHIP